jgi:hypothetical protein
MPKYVIERELPGVGSLTPMQFQVTAQGSCEVLAAMGPEIQWVQSFVTEDKIYSVYIAPDHESVRVHARNSGLPANSIAMVTAVIDSTTAED